MKRIRLFRWAWLLLGAAWAFEATAIDIRPIRKIESSDLDRFRGVWVVAGGQMTWEFSGDRYRIYNAGQLVADLRIRLNEKKSPREFDVWYDGNDENLRQAYPEATPYRGIYEFRDQQLIRCVAPPGQPRPGSFDSAQGSTTALERVQPAKVSDKK